MKPYRCLFIIVIYVVVGGIAGFIANKRTRDHHTAANVLSQPLIDDEARIAERQGDFGGYFFFGSDIEVIASKFIAIIETPTIFRRSAALLPGLYYDREFATIFLHALIGANLANPDRFKDFQPIVEPSVTGVVVAFEAAIGVIVGRGFDVESLSTLITPVVKGLAKESPKRAMEIAKDVIPKSMRALAKRLIYEEWSKRDWEWCLTDMIENERGRSFERDDVLSAALQGAADIDPLEALGKIEAGVLDGTRKRAMIGMIVGGVTAGKPPELYQQLFESYLADDAATKLPAPIRISAISTFFASVAKTNPQLAADFANTLSISSINATALTAIKTVTK